MIINNGIIVVIVWCKKTGNDVNDNASHIYIMGIDYLFGSVVGRIIGLSNSLPFHFIYITIYYCIILFLLAASSKRMS